MDTFLRLPCQPPPHGGPGPYALLSCPWWKGRPYSLLPLRSDAGAIMAPLYASCDLKSTTPTSPGIVHPPRWRSYTCGTRHLSKDVMPRSTGSAPYDPGALRRTLHGRDKAPHNHRGVTEAR